MFDIGLSEIFIVLIAGIIFIRPKDFPVVIKFLSKIFRTIKSWVKEIKDIFTLIQDVDLKDDEK